MTPEEKEKLRAACDDLLTNTAKFKKQWDEKARKENPHMTEEQLSASWDIVAKQFGL